MITNLKELEKHVLDEYPKEACGIVVEDKFIPLFNSHPNPVDNFLIGNEIYFQYKEILQGIIHSHCSDSITKDIRSPSLHDMQSAEDTAVPWGIIGCDGENVTELVWFNSLTEIQPLLGRVYLSGIYDCFTLLRDFYVLNFNYDIGICPREINWQVNSPSLLQLTLPDYIKGRFVKMPNEGDTLAFCIGSAYVNHLGVYLGKGKFLHHLHNSKSRVDELSRWKAHLTSIFRPEEIENGNMQNLHARKAKNRLWRSPTDTAGRYIEEFNEGSLC